MKCFPLKPEDWPGYHLKRHHTGRSFAGRVHDLFHYCFRASDSSSSGSASVAEGVSLLDMLQQVQQQSTPTKPAGKASRKRVHVLVDGKYATGQDGGYCCLCCSRSFPTEQVALKQLEALGMNLCAWIPRSIADFLGGLIDMFHSFSLCCRVCARTFTMSTSSARRSRAMPVPRPPPQR